MLDDFPYVCYIKKQSSQFIMVDVNKPLDYNNRYEVTQGVGRGQKWGQQHQNYY